MKSTIIARITLLLMTVGAVLFGAGLTANAAPPDYPPATATVSGHIYLDTNGNNTQDPGEPNLAGVDVRVTDSSTVAQTVTTDANGNWTAVVLPGEVVADVDETTLPPNVVQTEGTDPTVVMAVSGENADAGNDGYVPAATVSGHLYLDTNGNGTQDPGEPNLPGVKITVTDSAGKTQVVMTDVDGDWTAAVRPGSTTMTVDVTTLPNGLKLSEGSNTRTLTAVSGVNTSFGNNGYTNDDGKIPGTGSNSTLTGIWLGFGLLALGAGLRIVTQRRRQPAVA